MVLAPIRDMTRMIHLLLILGLVALAAPADAAYPERPVRLIVPFPPGGAVDVTARIVSERLAVGLGQPVVIDNRAGAGGALGAELAAKAAPDGYTLLVGSSSTHGTNSAVHKALPYDPVADFTPIVLLARFPFLLIASPKLPVRSPAELVALARGRADKLNYASYGPGSANHLPMELFLAMTDLAMVHVPYKGATPAMAAITQGEVDVAFDSPNTSLQPIRSGLVTLLGVGSTTRSPFFPDMPTIAETGLPGFESSSFTGFFAPAKTPAEVIERVHRETVAALALPEVRARLEAAGYEVVGGTGAVLGETVKTTVEKWQRLVQERRLTFD
jgi:tripartite-type tricarboxylate transporter receptor subunit TctC